MEAHTLWLLAEVAAVPEPLDVAEILAQYCEPLKLATDLGVRPIVADCPPRALFARHLTRRLVGPILGQAASLARPP